MAIRKNTYPQQMDLQPEMRDLLMRNGMQAHVVSNGSGYQLVVQGHDSPLLTYNITEKRAFSCCCCAFYMYDAVIRSCGYSTSRHINSGKKILPSRHYLHLVDR